MQSGSEAQQIQNSHSAPTDHSTALLPAQQAPAAVGPDGGLDDFGFPGPALWGDAGPRRRSAVCEPEGLPRVQTTGLSLERPEPQGPACSHSLELWLHWGHGSPRGHLALAGTSGCPRPWSGCPGIYRVGATRCPKTLCTRARRPVPATEDDPVPHVRVPGWSLSFPRQVLSGSGQCPHSAPSGCPRAPAFSPAVSTRPLRSFSGNLAPTPRPVPEHPCVRLPRRPLPPPRFPIYLLSRGL